MGNAWFDVLGVTVLPRQDGLAPVEMSRGNVEPEPVKKEFNTVEQFDIIKETEPADKAGDINPQPQDEGSIEMAKKETNELAEPVALMHRGDVDHKALFGAAGIESGGDVSDVVIVLKRNQETIETLTAELDQLQKIEADRKSVV